MSGKATHYTVHYTYKNVTNMYGWITEWAYWAQVQRYTRQRPRVPRSQGPPGIHLQNVIEETQNDYKEM